MEVSTERPPATAVAEHPLPSWNVMIRTWSMGVAVRAA